MTYKSVGNLLVDSTYRSGSVDKIVLEEGYYDMANSRVEYTIHNHLGSPRVILSDLNGDATISTSNMGTF